ncbi:chromate efflux transporter [Pseudaestuariivita sp.]|uniref:chromate efflux transporter n=1 Tax=Pseudaestuariivita sp. TaxID=2211669 RepID=UPI004059B40C
MMEPTPTNDAETLPEFTRTFARIGVLSFGGPAAQIALMQQVLVEEKKYLSQDAFLRALSFCMLLPGPEAMQLATYAGWHRRGIPGGLIAGLLFVLPGALVIAALGALYLTIGTQPLFEALLTGVQAAVIAIVIKALIGLSKRALDGTRDIALAAASFVAIWAFDVPFPLLLLTAACVGALFYSRAQTKPASTAARKPTPPATIALWAALWVLPLALLWLAGAEFLLDLGLFFSQLAVISFGGAYALLAYMAQTLVEVQGWVTEGQMIDALGLAETTPGPLILVTQFVALLAGYGAGGWGLALAAMLLCLWVTFVPCFLWIFAGAPYIDRLAGMPRLSGALSAITVAVVGVIASLALWFAGTVLFARPDALSLLGLTLPDPNSLRLGTLALVALAAALLLWRKVSLGVTLCATSGAALAAHLIAV